MIIAHARRHHLTPPFPRFNFTERKGRSVRPATMQQSVFVKETDVLLRVRYDIRVYWHRCFSCKYNQLDSKILQNK